MQGPVLIIALVALGGGLYYISNQADESATRRAAMQQAATVASSSDVTASSTDMYDVSSDEGGIRGALARAAVEGYENPEVPTDPEEIAAATKAMQTDVRQAVMARTGLDIGTLDPIKRMAAAEKARQQAEGVVEANSAPEIAPASEPAAKIVTAEEVLKKSRSREDAEAAAGALKSVMNKAMNDPRLADEIEKLVNQLDDPERGRKLVAEARAKGAPEFAIVLGLKRQVDKEAEEAEEAAAPKLPKTAGQFEGAEKSKRFKSAERDGRFKSVNN